MKKIPSFTIDHCRLLRGVYVSRRDKVGGEEVTTFDIRMKEPNREPALHQGAIHTIEHLAATYLRNDAEWKDKIVYWGPMGCLTGNYLLIKGDLKSADIVDLRAIFLALLHATAATGFYTTGQWHAMSQGNTLPKCSTALRTRIWNILHRQLFIRWTHAICCNKR